MHRNVRKKFDTKKLWKIIFYRVEIETLGKINDEISCKINKKIYEKFRSWENVRKFGIKVVFGIENI